PTRIGRGETEPGSRGDGPSVSLELVASVSPKVQQAGDELLLQPHPFRIRGKSRKVALREAIKVGHPLVGRRKGLVKMHDPAVQVVVLRTPVDVTRGQADKLTDSLCEFLDRRREQFAKVEVQTRQPGHRVLVAGEVPDPALQPEVQAASHVAFYKLLGGDRVYPALEVPMQVDNPDVVEGREVGIVQLPRPILVVTKVDAVVDECITIEVH